MYNTNISSLSCAAHNIKRAAMARTYLRCTGLHTPRSIAIHAHTLCWCCWSQPYISRRVSVNNNSTRSFTTKHLYPHSPRHAKNLSMNVVRRLLTVCRMCASSPVLAVWCLLPLREQRQQQQQQHRQHQQQCVLYRVLCKLQNNLFITHFITAFSYFRLL